jgi:glycosyltransferase involved in cell wall biosynthesis
VVDTDRIAELFMTMPVDLFSDGGKLPRISIVTPSFNQVQYLEATIRSVLDQGYPNLEWIVVDGGSKDGSVELIRKYEKHFTWWVSEKDRNHPHALNKGCEKVTGEIFGFVNSDDLLEPGALRYVARAFLEPEVKWIVGWAKYFDNAGDEWVYGPQRFDRAIDWFLHNPIPQISTFWRTEAFKNVGPFTEKYLWSFDYEYWMRMHFVGKWTPVYVRRCLGAFRLHEQSKTVSKPGNYGPDNKALHEEYAKYLTGAQRKRLAVEGKKLAATRARLAAWEALKKKDVRGARKLAMESVRGAKLSKESWRAVYSAVRGH